MIKYIEITLMDTRVGGTEKKGLLHRVVFSNNNTDIDYIVIQTQNEKFMVARFPLFFIKALDIVYVGFHEMKNFYNTFISWCNAVTELKYCLATLSAQGLRTASGSIDTTRYIGVPEEYSRKSAAAKNTTYFIQDRVVPKVPEVFFLRRKTDKPSEKELDILSKKLLAVKEGTYIMPVVIEDKEEPEKEVSAERFRGRTIPEYISSRIH